MGDNATADFAVAARAIVKGLAVVPSGSALQQGSHRSRTRRSMCNILASATILSMQRRQQCLDWRVQARFLSMQSLSTYFRHSTLTLPACSAMAASAFSLRPLLQPALLTPHARDLDCLVAWIR